jgi:tetratricopeptide (TPR) repeat protein
MKVYTAVEAARLLGLSAARVTAIARAGRLGERVGPRRTYRFGFQDLVLLRAAKSLISAEVPHRRILRMIRKLREQVPEGRPLSAVQFLLEDGQVVAKSGGEVWSPESGQRRFDFDRAVADGRRLADARGVFRVSVEEDLHLGAAEWFEIGTELEELAAEEAREAYRRALELEPLHVEAHVRLAGILRRAGDPAAAERHCRIAVEEDPRSAGAFTELGLALDGLDRPSQAAGALRRAVRLGGRSRQAVETLARLAEREGDAAAAAHWRRQLAALRDDA